ncbi:hypothetical protein [Escherichia phage CLB_P2]|nr:hypothetical protein [Escherichia phage CLB_P2]
MFVHFKFSIRDKDWWTRSSEFHFLSASLSVVVHRLGLANPIHQQSSVWHQPIHIIIYITYKDTE